MQVKPEGTYGGVKCPSRRPPTTGSYMLVPPRSKEEVLFNVFEPKLVDSLLYAKIDIFNHGIQGTATWSQLSFVPHLSQEKNIRFIIV